AGSAAWMTSHKFRSSSISGVALLSVCAVRACFPGLSQETSPSFAEQELTTFVVEMWSSSSANRVYLFIASLKSAALFERPVSWQKATLILVRTALWIAIWF